MTPVALSDLVLTLACLWICRVQGRHSAALTLGTGLIGLAAALGVAFYSGVVALDGPHHLASQLSASGAFPLLAIGYGWADHPVSRRYRWAAAVSAGSGLVGLGAAKLGLTQAGNLITIVSVVAMILVTARSPSRVRIIGLAFLIASLAVVVFSGSVTLWGYTVSRIEMLHDLLAIALVVLFGTGTARR